MLLHLCGWLFFRDLGGVALLGCGGWGGGFMRAEQIVCLCRGGDGARVVATWNRFKPPGEVLFTHRSGAILLSWFVFVVVRL